MLLPSEKPSSSNLIPDSNHVKDVRRGSTSKAAATDFPLDTITSSTAVANSSDLVSPAPPTYTLTPEAGASSTLPTLASPTSGAPSVYGSNYSSSTADKKRRPHTPAHSTTQLLPADDETTTSYPPQGPVINALAPTGRTMTIDQQPSPKEVMSVPVTGSRNARQMPVDLRGNRDWSSGLCGCYTGDDHEMDTCCTACFCPCIIFGRNKTRMDHLANHNSPEPSGGRTEGDCATHGIMSFFFIVGGCALQVPLRATIRDRYSISGSCLGDGCTSVWCYPCALTQEHIEISAEEHSFPRGVGGSSGVYYDDPKRVRRMSIT